MPETALNALQPVAIDPNDPHAIHRAILALGDLQAQIDSLKITLYKSLNASRQFARLATLTTTQENS